MIRLQELLVLVVPLLAGLLSAAITPRERVSMYYRQLRKPAVSPPSWVFGPVWVVLYLAMGAAALVYYRQRGSLPALFWVQLGLNVAWSPVFFGVQDTYLALVLIAALLVTASQTAVVFAWSAPLAGYALVPYIVWLSFATYLNAYIAFNNP